MDDNKNDERDFKPSIMFLDGIFFNQVHFMQIVLTFFFNDFKKYFSNIYIYSMYIPRLWRMWQKKRKNVNKIKWKLNGEIE